jgi:hypothetical protein
MNLIAYQLIFSIMQRIDFLNMKFVFFTHVLIILIN